MKQPVEVPVPPALAAKVRSLSRSLPPARAGDALAERLVRTARFGYDTDSSRAFGAGRPAMPNQPSVHKRVLSLQLPRDLYYAVKQAAAEHKLDLAVYVRMVLSEATIDIELTPESLAASRRETAAAKARRAGGASPRPAKKGAKK